MSKLFNKFEQLKKENPDKLYLIKSGIFYLGLDEDAKILSDLFGFKITNLNDKIIKCGFPEKKLEFYTNLLEKCAIEYEIINEIHTEVSIIENQNKQLSNSIKKIKNLDMNTISFKEAFSILEKLNNLLNQGEQ